LIAETTEVAATEAPVEVVAETIETIADVVTAPVTVVDEAPVAEAPVGSSGLQANLIFPAAEETIAVSTETVAVESAVSESVAAPTEIVAEAESAPVAVEVDAEHDEDGDDFVESAEGSDEDHSHEPENSNLDSRGRPRRPRTGGRPPKKRAPAVE